MWGCPKGHHLDGTDFGEGGGKDERGGRKDKEVRNQHVVDMEIPSFVDDMCMESSTGRGTPTCD